LNIDITQKTKAPLIRTQGGEERKNNGRRMTPILSVAVKRRKEK
jgi:hypothetical protein